MLVKITPLPNPQFMVEQVLTQIYKYKELNSKRSILMQSRYVVHSKLLSIFIVLMISQVAAQQLLNYQGYLMDLDGRAISGKKTLTFRIYADSTTKTALWEEQLQDVEMDKGVFNVLLGGYPPFPSNLFNSSASLYLGIQIEGSTSELTPRFQITSVPFAVHAVYADTAMAISAAGILGSGFAEPLRAQMVNRSVLYGLPGDEVLSYDAN